MKVNFNLTVAGHTLAQYFVLLLFSIIFISVTLVQGTDLIGCFENNEHLQRINRVHELKVNNCIKVCIEEEKIYAALETQICYCTNTKDDLVLVENARCFPCSINPDEQCGGFGVVAVYATGIKGK